MASKSKTIATGVTRHALSDWTLSFQADVDLKGYDRPEETFAARDDAKTWRQLGHRGSARSPPVQLGGAA
jgi:hypothetical protein